MLNTIDEKITTEYPETNIKDFINLITWHCNLCVINLLKDK